MKAQKVLEILGTLDSPKRSPDLVRKREDAIASVRPELVCSIAGLLAGSFAPFHRGLPETVKAEHRTAEVTVG